MGKPADLGGNIGDLLKDGVALFTNSELSKVDTTYGWEYSETIKSLAPMIQTFNFPFGWEEALMCLPFSSVVMITGLEDDDEEPTDVACCCCCWAGGAELMFLLIP